MKRSTACYRTSGSALSAVGLSSLARCRQVGCRTAEPSEAHRRHTSHEHTQTAGEQQKTAAAISDTAAPTRENNDCKKPQLGLESRRHTTSKSMANKVEAIEQDSQCSVTTCSSSLTTNDDPALPSMTSIGSTTLPSDFDIFLPCASRTTGCSHTS